jgi:hypothetical protein
MLVVQNKKVYQIVESNWKTYKALLTQTGTDAPVARVLNQDEDDYLGDLNFLAGEIIDDTAEFYIIENFENSLTGFNLTTTYGLILSIGISMADGQILGSMPKNSVAYLEIKVRQRGIAPVLLSAETNELGNKVILTFDKKMNSYLFDSIENVLLLSDKSVTEVVVDDKTIELTLDTSYTDTDVISFDYDASIALESFDYGLVEEIVDFSVTNKVV